MNKGEQVETHREVSPAQHRAMYLRSRGLTMRQIAEDEEVNASYRAVRDWFMEGGPLHDEYERYKAQIIAERESVLSDSIEQLREDTARAIATLIEIMNDTSAGSKERQMMQKNRLDAARDILDRTIGKVQNLDITTKGKPLSPGNYSTEELLQLAAEHGLDITKYSDSEGSD